MADTNYKLRAWMGANRISGAELARRTGISYNTLKLKLSGKTKWTLSDVEKLLAVTGLTFEELF